MHENSRVRDHGTHRKRYLYTKTSDVMAAKNPDRKPSIIPKTNTTVCFKCGMYGHIYSSSNSESKAPRRCYACNGITHMSLKCSSQNFSQLLNLNTKSSNAVASTGIEAVEFVNEAIIEGVRIHMAVVNTCPKFSMLCFSLYTQLPNRHQIQ